jgi:uncharacterized OsmC-like protein
MEVTIQHLGEVQFEVKARNHTIYCDQPAEAGGFDEGMTPPEFFLASLGTCAGYYAAQYIKARKLNPDGLRVRVSAEKVKNPARLDNIKIHVDYPQALEAHHHDGLLRAVHQCLIHATLLTTPTITTEIHAAGVSTPSLAHAA